MTEPRLLLGDCVEQMRTLPDASIDAIVTDPPYGIRFMGKAWDGAEIEHEVARRRALGREADGGDFGNGAQSAGIYDVSLKGNRAFQQWTEAWAVEALRVLKPGGHLLSFASTRTYHRMASGVEDAGFEVRDTIAYMYGSGFPKSLDVSKAIDKAEGAEGTWRQEDHPGRSGARTSRPEEGADIGQTHHASEENPEGLRHVYEPTTEAAQRWDGWGTALKPAFEPVVVARKPLTGTVAGNVLAHGTGAINVDGCRVEFRGASDEAESKEKNRHGDFGTEQGGNAVYGDYSMLEGRGNYDPPGRWPANVLLGHHPECVEVGTREVRGTGHTPSARPSSGFAANPQPEEEERSWRRETVPEYDCHPDCAVRILDEQTGDVGAHGGGWDDENRNRQSGFSMRMGHPRRDSVGGASRFFYTAKTSRAERNAGLDSFDARPLNWSSGEQSPGTFQAEGTDRTARNHHPTVKPVALMRWLVRLVTPHGGTVLDPFMGSGTTGIAAALEGMEFVGIERDPGYMAICEARIGFWAVHGEDTLRIVAEREQGERRRAEIADAGQLDLFTAPA